VRLAAGIAIGAVLAPLPAAAQTEERAVRVPVRLTAGSDNSLMGVLSPDEKTLYFVNDGNATFELHVQAPVNGGPAVLFDAFGDVAWPALSADGASIAYVSYVADATGDACIRPLDGPASPGSETCITDASSAEIQAAWVGTSERLAVLSRPDLHSDFRLRSYAPTAGDAGRELATRNMTGMALSPDGRWLAYTPVERRTDRVGPAFANRTARGIRLQRLDGGDEIEFVPDLPGVTGYMAFSRAGDYLYFTQYLNDTNRDRVIDGNDNSVLFRVPFAGKRKNPVSAPRPDQLTSAQWNCHYPAPAASQLVMTCSHAGSLDIYSIDLEGAVPSAWNDDRIAAEIEVSRDLWTRLLLFGRLFSRAATPAKRRPILREMAVLHLRLREYESAVFYATRLADEAEGDQDRRWGTLIAELARHRRADDELARGELSRRYVRQERERRRRVVAAGTDASRDVSALATIVASEIDADLGGKKRALAGLESVDLAQVSDPATLLFAAQRARALYMLLGARTRLVGVLRTLSGHEALTIGERLRYADMTVNSLVRGLPRERRPAPLEKLRAGLDNDSELALLVDVELALNDLNDDNQEQVREQVFELFKRNEDPARRRAISLATVEAAARLGNEYLQYQFTKSWASGVKRASPERKYAEELYRTVVLERAYGEFEQNISEARGYFFGATLNSSSLEAHAGFIEAYVLEGKTDVRELYDKRFSRSPDDPVYQYALAYLEARRLPELADPAHEEAVTDIETRLERVAAARPREIEVHHLWAYALHQRTRRTKSRDAALAANRHYLLALDLARDRPRARAALLEGVGLLTASLGNHRRALQHFAERERLPFMRPGSELALRHAQARSLYFVRRDAEARAAAQRALAIVEKHPELKRFRIAIVDRVAFYHLSAGEHADSRDRYRELLKLLSRRDASPARRRNQVRARAALASALIGTGELDEALGSLDTLDELVGQGPLYEQRDDDAPALSLLDDYRYGVDQYRILSAGLRATALRRLGRLDDARSSLKRRRRLLQERFDDGTADEDLYDLARTSYQLGQIAYEGGRKADARQWLEQGLEESAQYNESTGSDVTEAHLALLRAYAELHLYGGVARSDLRRDLEQELRAAYSFIAKFPNPEWAPERFLFGLYLTMISVSSVGS